MSNRTPAEQKLDTKRWWEFHDKDTYVCPDCRRTQNEHGRRWEVHHINGEPGKCVGLCQTCHRVRHGAERRKIELGAWKREFLALGSDTATADE